MALTRWRPNENQLREAKALLQGMSGRWGQTRLEILDALGRQPASPDRQIARKAGTRTKVVTGLLERWRVAGIQSVARFGRPKDLDPTTLSEIRAKIESGALCCLADVAQMVLDKLQLRFSIATLRTYCREMGFNLPPQVRPRSKRIRQKTLRHQWTSEQELELKDCQPSMRDLATAILEAGTLPNESTNKIARAHKLPATSLRLNVKRFAKGGLKEVIAHRKVGDVLQRNGLQGVFFDWCNQKYDPSHQCPSISEAWEFLKSLKIAMPRRTVWTHLAKWRKSRGIAARRRRFKVNP